MKHFTTRELLKNNGLARHGWLTPVILAAQGAKIRRISV
jgi:hypothetical protein